MTRYPRQTRPTRVAVVGAGPGGLAAAMLLARSGAEVTLYERAPRPGGRSATIEGHSPVGTFRFDTGPTFFLYPRVLADIFDECGFDLAREAQLTRLDPQYELRFEAGGRLAATSDLARMQAAVAAIAPEDARHLARFMADNRRKLAAFRPVLEKKFDSVLGFLRPDTLRALPLLRPHRSVDSDLARYFGDERIRLAFSFQSKYLGMSPFRCPSLFTILAFMEYEYGVWHPRGGCGAVIDAMARASRALGVDIRLGEAIEEIVVTRGRARGIRTAAGEEAYDAVVVNADFAHAMRNLVANDARRKWRNETIDRKKFSCSTFMLYLGIEGLCEDLAHHTVHLSADYRQNVGEIEAGLVPPANPSFYVQNASVTDDSVAPPGHSTLYVLVPVGNRRADGIDWQREAPRFRAQTLDRLAHLGISDVERRIRFERMVTPADWESDFAIHRGATFNLAHSIDQMLCFRPHNRFEDIEGMYLVGGGTHPGSGLPVIFESARITSRLLAEDFGLSRLPSTALMPEPADAEPHRAELVP